MLSLLYRFQKRITRIFLIFQCIRYLYNRSLIDISKDFWTFSEIFITQGFTKMLFDLALDHVLFKME